MFSAGRKTTSCCRSRVQWNKSRNREDHWTNQEDQWTKQEDQRTNREDLWANREVQWTNQEDGMMDVLVMQRQTDRKQTKRVSGLQLLLFVCVWDNHNNHTMFES